MVNWRVGPCIDAPGQEWNGFETSACAKERLESLIFFLAVTFLCGFRDLPGALGPWTSPTCFAQPSDRRSAQKVLWDPKVLAALSKERLLVRLHSCRQHPSHDFAGVSHEISTLNVHHHSFACSILQSQCATATHSTAIP